MIDRFQRYFGSLELLSTEALDHSVEKLVRAETRSTALVIAHFAEMSRKKGALELGYKSLFDYAMKRLNLSEGSVALRLQVANVCRRIPRILAALADNRISLSVAGLLAPHLTEDNVETLLDDCAGMTKRAAAEYLVALRPKPIFEPSIRKQPTPSSPPAPAEPAPPRTNPEPNAAPPPTRPTPTIVQQATPEHYNFRFSAGKEFKEKLERLGEVLGVENPTKNMAELLEKPVDLALGRKGPRKKRERRRVREARRTKRASEEFVRTSFFPQSNTSPSRHVATEVSERLFERTGYRCEFRAQYGTCCTSRTGLEVEHTRPFGIYRSHDERFLKVFCRAHNALSAERAYGADFIQQKIAARRIDERMLGES